MSTCRKCGATRDHSYTAQTISDGRTQIRIDCGICGAFIKWAPQKDGPTFNERMFQVIRHLSEWDGSPSDMHVLKTEAKMLMREAQGESNGSKQDSKSEQPSSEATRTTTGHDLGGAYERDERGAKRHRFTHGIPTKP